VDHPVLAPADLVRPWRLATLVLTGVAAVELVLLLGAGAVLLGRQLGPHVVGTHTKKHPAQAVPAKHRVRHAPIPKRQPIGVPKLSRRQIAVLVLNGNGRTGAAGAEAARVRGKGYRISQVGNARRTDYARSIVMYRPGYRAEGYRLARDLRVGIVTPLDGMHPRALGGAKLAVVVGG
jgi:LytR cell envelope-related transcriptional attenuator